MRATYAELYYSGGSNRTVTSFRMVQSSATELESQNKERVSTFSGLDDAENRMKTAVAYLSHVRISATGMCYSTKYYPHPTTQSATHDVL